MRKNLILGIVLIAFAMLVGWFFFFAPDDQGTSSTETETGDTQVFNVPVTEWPEDWTPGVSSDDIPTGNPLDRVDVESLGTPLDERGTREVEQGDEYVISYYGTDSSIFITLKSEPIAAARIDAERAFLRDFGLTKAEACRLNVVLNVMGSVAPYAAARDYGLSFCPDGLPLPEK